ncbi:MAG: arginase family protein, partial [Bacteroidales bacterium]|nr:arginase family protein [Bacteroidales bacterium]
MDISIYFEPIDLPSIEAENSSNLMGDLIRSHIDPEKFPKLSDVDIALIGVKEDRGSVNNQGCSFAPDYIRNSLYGLYRGNFNVKIADLGNIKRGHQIEDTYYALSTTLTELIKNKIIP